MRLAPAVLLLVACLAFANAAPRASSSAMPSADSPMAADEGDNLAWMNHASSHELVRDTPMALQADARAGDTSAEVHAVAPTLSRSSAGHSDPNSFAGSEFANNDSPAEIDLPASLLRMDSTREGRELMRAIAKDDKDADDMVFKQSANDQENPHSDDNKLHHSFPRSVLAAHFGGLDNDCCARYADKEEKEFCDVLPSVRSDNEITSLATRCFGAYGSGFDCGGVKWINATSKRIKGDAMRKLFVSVGSIVHANCCLRFPRGQMCSDDVTYNAKFAEMFWDDKCACAREWNKARENFKSGRYWVVRMNPSSDQTVQLARARPTWTPSSYPVEWKDLTKATLRGKVTETKTSRKLFAPAGTKLDCPQSDPRCRPDANNRNIVAGDSLFCSSGVFSEVVLFENTRDGDSGTGYGVCAEGRRRKRLTNDPPMTYDKVYLPYKDEGDLKEQSLEDQPPKQKDTVKEFQKNLKSREKEFEVEQDSVPSNSAVRMRMAGRRRSVRALGKVRAQLQAAHEQVKAALANTQQHLAAVNKLHRLQRKKVALLQRIKESGAHRRVRWPRGKARTSRQFKRPPRRLLKREPEVDGVVLPAPPATRVLPRKKKQQRFKFIRGSPVHGSRKSIVHTGKFMTTTVGQPDEPKRKGPERSPAPTADLED